jgi:hypothetical protein
MNTYSYNSDTCELEVYSRDPADNVPIFTTQMLDLRSGSVLSQAIDLIYQQGVKAGRQGLARTVRSVLPESSENEGA